jgi:hypothetical protein
MYDNDTKGTPMSHTEHSPKTSRGTTGFFAMLGAFLGAKGGTGVPKTTKYEVFPVVPVFAPVADIRRRVLMAFGSMLALASALAISATAAQAEPPKLISYSKFASEGPGVAVDQVSGDVFTASLADLNERGEGTFVGHIRTFEASGKELPSSYAEGSERLYSGAAIDPANGDLYVLGQEGLFGGVVKLFVYDPNTGALLSSFAVPASINVLGILTDVQIAVDSAGNVYVPVVPENKVLEYSSGGTLLKTFTGSGAGVLKEPTAVAIESSGDLWVASSGNNRIVELASSGAPVEVNGKPVEIESEGVWSVALDGHGDVFAVVANNADPCGEIGSSCPHLVEYSSEGRQLADVGAGDFGTPEGGDVDHFLNMVAVDEASGRVYVTDGSKRTVWIFGPPTAPVVHRELTAEIGTSEAKLGALVNPGGIQTSYRFEYGPSSAYGSSTPFPEGSVGEGLESHAVWASASGLAPGSTYHYRVVASNELGTVYGPDQTFTTLSAEQAACPNEQMRGGFAARLSDCRAYELVTPPVPSASQFDSEVSMAYESKAAADGEALTLTTREPRPGAPTAGESYVATRGAGGWATEDIMPLESYDGLACTEHQNVYAYSEQLTKDVLLAGGVSRASASENAHENPESCNPEGRQVVSGEPVGYENLLVRDNATGTYQLVNVTPPGVMPADAHFQAASADLSHVIFTETSPLAEGGRYGVENLYEWDEGALRLVSVLPDGTAVPGSLAATGEFSGSAEHEEHEGVVSSDGSHVLFTYGGALYDRIDGQRTVQVDETQGGVGASGGGSLKAASSDGSEVFFLDESKLTADSTAATGEPDLYECALPASASKCELSDLTVAGAGEHADVLRVTPLGGHDSSYVYFVAKGVLASNTREITNGEGTTVVEGAEAGKQNLYLRNGEKTTFIASGVEHSHFGIEQTSPDGKWLAFESKKSLTGYDDAVLRGESAELFLYGAGSGAGSGSLVCASCNPSGEPPASEAGGVTRRGRTYREFHGVFTTRHVLTDAGQVFFETPEALVPSDTNGELDVYEYEGGGAHLISSGTSSFETTLEDVSESGDDVFFRSDQALVPQDNQEGMLVTYDARVAGGFVEPSSPPLCTTADACRAAVAPQPSVYGEPASQTFSGVGNLAPPPEEVKPKAKPKAKPVKCKKGFAKKQGKCVRKPAKKAKKSAHANRKGK